MGIDSDTKSFQQNCWDRLYDTLFVDFFNNFEYNGSEVTISFIYKAFHHEDKLDEDYNSAILDKTNYCRPLRLTTRILKNSTGEHIDADDLGLIMIPELTPRGFIIGGNCYDVVNLFREAFGWYITLDKSRNVIMSLKTRQGGKYIIFEKNNELFIEHNGRKVGFGIFLKAITGLDSQNLISLIGSSNNLIRKTIIDQLNTRGYELPISECIKEAVYITAGGNKSKEDFNKVSDSSLITELQKNLSRIDIGNEGVERYKKFVSFQRRAEGAVLLDDVKLTDGTVITSGTNLSRIDLIRMDNDDSINEITVDYSDTTYCIKKFPVNNGEFNSDMVSNIASIAFAVFSGLGLLDDRDSLENRVVENVAYYIVECVREYLVNDVCKQLDSYKNKTITDINKLAVKLADCKDSNYVVHKYKEENIVQLKDDVNIISELSKTYKLSYKKKSDKSRVGDAVRNIKVKQFMRVCPIDTPESKEVGLNTYLTMTAGVDKNGFVTASYVDIKTGEIVKMNALEEMGIPIMVWNGDIENNEFVNAHIDGEFSMVHRSQIRYKDVSPMGLLSFSTGSVPFIENDKSKRALMAANMNRQAVHVLGSERPLVVTGSDNILDFGITRAKDVIREWASSKLIDLTEEEINNTTLTLSDIGKGVGKINSVRALTFTADNAKLFGKYIVDIPYYLPSTSGCYYYIQVSSEKTRFKGDDVVYYHRDIQMDDKAVCNEPNFGEMLDISKDRINECGYGIGRNLKILFKSYKGYTYEDAVVINRDLFEDKSLTSIYLTEVEVELQESPSLKVVESFGINGLNFTQEETAYMQDNGLPAIGSYIRSGQVVVGRIRREVKSGELNNERIENASVTLDSKSEGWVVDARIISGAVGTGKQDIAVVSIASFKDVSLGDKYVGRHGNKGVVAKVVPAEDMPFGEDGTIPDMILNPLGTIARGNFGQLCECILGMAGYKMQKRFVVPALSDDNYETMQAAREVLRDDYGFDEMTVYDGETGLPYPKKMLFGVMHMYKLLHIAERPSKVIGAAGNSVQEYSQQPRNGQRISELQTNAYIAHGATETLDSFFSIQSDDIKGAKRLQNRVRHGGSSVENGIDIQGENKSDEIVRAYIRTLGADFVTVDGGISFKYLTDDDILDISGTGMDNVITDSSNNAVIALHNETIFGAESNKASRTEENRIKRRNNYGRIELGYSVIMPIIFRNSYFLNRFSFLHWSFNTATMSVEGEDIEYLKVSVERKSISSSTVSDLLEGKFTSYAYSPATLSVINTKDLDAINSKDLREEALTIIRSLGFDDKLLVDKNKKDKFYSPHKIDVLAEMYRNYNNEGLLKAHDKVVGIYDNYESDIASMCDYDENSSSNKFRYIIFSKQAISSMVNKVGINGAEYFVTKMLVMPSSFRPRYTTTRGERHNDIDSTYIKILSCSNDLKSHRERRMAIDYDVSRLYQALDSCYKKPEGSKSKISIANLLLSSTIDKTSTVIRGYVGAKRVSYSSRSVIVVNPNLHLTECGIPYKHALILWEDNLINSFSDVQIVENKTALSGKSIHKLIKYLVDGNYYAIGVDLFDVKTNPVEFAKEVEDIIISELSTIMKNEIVILNREPALHKFNNMAFVPVLSDGLSIQLHPLVCAAYNADFDGDTMSNIVCKSDTAKREAREKMMTTNNIINPKDGKNIISLKQDIVLGIYMLTMLENNSSEEVDVTDRVPVSFYDSIKILEQDIDLGYISIYDYVAYRSKEKGSDERYLYVSTAGRILFNSLLPDYQGFTKNEVVSGSNIYKLLYDCRINGKTLNNIVVKCYETNINNKVTIELLDRFKDCGFKYADKSGATISINDFDDRSVIVEDKLNSVNDIINKYNKYEKLKLFPTEEKRNAVVKLWNNELKDMQGTIESSMDTSGSVFAIIDSGARGSTSDYNAISGIVGQVRNVDNTVIERPILGNFLKGLTVDEYFISTYQARRGQISTSTKTADSGKNNRDISHMLNNVLVVENDCGAKPYKFKLKWSKIKEPFASSIIGKKITGCKYKYFIGKTICSFIPEDGDDNDYLTLEGLELTQLTEIELDGVNYNIPRHLDSVHRSLLEGRVIERDTNEWLPKNILTNIEYTDSDTMGSELVLNDKAITFIEDNPKEHLDLRLLIGCCSKGGVCSKCYGRDVETKKLIAVGKYIGLISAMAISEVATQGTMNMHHATASASGMGDIATRFKNAMNAKEMVRVSKTYNNETGELEYSVSLIDGGKFTKVADKLDKIGYIREAGLALTNGIVNITDKVTADGKTVVELINNDVTYEYYIFRDKLIVNQGEEVNEFQPLFAPYDYNQIMTLNEDYAREFFILDFASIFIGSGSNIRAIHFELIGREQTNYVEVNYDIDGCKFSEVFPKYISHEDIYNELVNRYAPAVVTVNSVKPTLASKSAVMDSRDIIANAFSDSMFAKVGKYCMNGKVDKCTSPLTNLFVGKKTRGTDAKKFSTITNSTEVKEKQKNKFVIENTKVEELYLSDDEYAVDESIFAGSSIFEDDMIGDDGSVADDIVESSSMIDSRDLSGLSFDVEDVKVKDFNVSIDLGEDLTFDV